jgi:pilus assembly protein CpaB
MTDSSGAQNSKFAAVLFTAVAGGLGLLVAFLVLKLLSIGGYTKEAVRVVVVAARGIESGSPLSEEDLKLVQIPISAIPEGAFASTDELLKPVPRIATGAFAAGTPIIDARLSTSEAGPGLASLVPKDFRAAVIRVDKGIVDARVLFPGARIDVLATMKDPNSNTTHGASTRTIIENVKVLGVGKHADVDAARRAHQKGEEGAANDLETVVTIEVSPVDAERVTLAAREGKLDIVLRNALDKGTTGTHGVFSSDLVASAGTDTAVVMGGEATSGAADSVTGRGSKKGGSARPSVRLNARETGTNDQGGSRGGVSIEIR